MESMERLMNFEFVGSSTKEAAEVRIFKRTDLEILEILSWDSHEMFRV